MPKEKQYHMPCFSTLSVLLYMALQGKVPLFSIGCVHATKIGNIF